MYNEIILSKGYHKAINDDLKNICKIKHLRPHSVEASYDQPNCIISCRKKTSLKYDSIKINQLALFYKRTQINT